VSFSATLNAMGFDASDYVPQGIQDDIATGQAYYQQFSSATQGLTIAPGGRIELTDAQSKAALGGITGAMALAGPEGAALGLLTAAILALGPKAGAGPGVCSTSPPPGPLLSQLQSWPYFGSWADRFGSYPAAAPNSFESFANPVLEYNWLLWNNCYDFQTPPPTLLATLIASWNASHDSSSLRTVVRTGLNPSGFNSEANTYDPIANALEMAFLSKYVPAAGQTFEQATTPSGAPNGVSSSFAINNGTEIIRLPHILTLTLRPPAPTVTAPLTATAPPSAAKTAVGMTVAAAGTLTIAAIAISLVKGKAWDWAFGQAWAEIKDVLSAGGPHKFLTERPIRARARRSGKVRP
jgi:hypothetical protein